MTLTIIVILAVAVVLLIAALAILMGLFWRKNRELKQKNDAIIREMYRSQNIIERAVKHGVSRAALLSLLFGVCIVGKAQEEYFEYYDDEKTIITGLTSTGEVASSLTIPSSVTTVRADAFSGAKASALVVNAATISFGSQATSGIAEAQFSSINFCKEMDASSMISVISGLGSLFSDEGILEIEGLDGCSGSINLSSVLRGKTNVHVIMPAALVRECNKDDFNFGEFDGDDVADYKCAKVFGHFVLTTDVGTFCGSAKFCDTNDGSNFLFYVPTGVTTVDGDKMVHVQRVSYIMAGKGVIIHNELNTADAADLPRYNGDLTSDDISCYNSNMLVGTLEPTHISATDGDKTNMILYNGLFYKTSGGTLGANRAYLQISTDELPASGKMAIYVDDEGETTVVESPLSSFDSRTSDMYNLAGQRVEESYRGIVIQNGKKIKR